MSYCNNVLFLQGIQSWRITDSTGYCVGGIEKVTFMSHTLCNSSGVSKLRGITRWPWPWRLLYYLGSKHDEGFCLFVFVVLVWFGLVGGFALVFFVLFS